MKVLFFIYSLQSGGAERATANLANYWAEKGHEIIIVTITGKNTDFYLLHPHIKRIELNMANNSKNIFKKIYYNIQRIINFRKVLKEENPQAVIAMMSTANIYLSISRIGIKKMICIGTEQIYPPKIHLGLLWEILRKYLYKNLDSIVTLTSENATWINNHIHTKHIAIIPNPLTYPLTIQEPILPIESYMKYGRRILLSVGRLEYQKGFDLLIETFSLIADKHNEWDLIIIGDGTLKNEITKMIKEKRLTNRVFLPGRVGNISQWYKSADIFVMSSRFEGFPNALIEAMAYGLPAVSFDCDTGPRDIIRHEIDGLLVPPNNILALKAALEKLMSDEDLRKKLKLHAVEVREKFSIENIANKWESLYNKLKNNQ